MRPVGTSLVAIGLLLAGCKPRERSTPPAYATAAQVALSGAAVIVGAGDIGVCGSPRDEQTAVLVDSILKADSAAQVESVVFTVGDNAYPAGLDRDFVRCFGPGWGDPKKSIMKRIRPSIGNHDSQSGRGAAYYRYFGARAGPPFKGYYSYDIGEWHAIALNSDLIAPRFAKERSAQDAWLKQDLRANTKKCTLAYFHRPRYSSGAHGPSPIMQGMWKTLAEGGVDLVFNGHDHNYERFLPMNAAGALDTLNGMAQFVVGTGGGNLTGIRSRVTANSAARIQGRWGVLVATLGSGEYRTSFIDIQGNVWDPSGRKCN